jgi:hypothetical protein
VEASELRTRRERREEREATGSIDETKEVNIEVKTRPRIHVIVRRKA